MESVILAVRRNRHLPAVVTGDRRCRPTALELALTIAGAVSTRKPGPG